MRTAAASLTEGALLWTYDERLNQAALPLGVAFSK
jgi:hypothetical protein